MSADCTPAAVALPTVAPPRRRAGDRVYITAAGVVVEREAPRKRLAPAAPLPPDRPDAPKMRRWAEEIDEVESAAPVRFVVCPVCGGNRARPVGNAEARPCTVCDGAGQIGGAA